MINPRANSLMIEKSASAPWTDYPWQYTCSTARADGRPRYCDGDIARTHEAAIGAALDHAERVHGVRI